MTKRNLSRTRRSGKWLRDSCLLLAVAPLLVLALPGDQDQQITVEAASSEIFLDENIVVYYGSDERPAVMTQGSLKISGTEITITRRNGELSKLTATGSPAQFQQQPAEEEEIVYGSGGIVEYDDTRQSLTVGNSARLRQGQIVLTGHQIEYEIDARQGRVVGGESEQRVQTVVTPEPEE